MMLFRDDLLAGRGVVLSQGVSRRVAEVLSGLGAAVERLGDGIVSDEGGAVSDAGGGVAIGADGLSLFALVHDAREPFGDGGPSALSTALQDAWDAVGRVAGEVLLPRGGGGKVVLIAPRAGAGRHAEAARAGLENLARTLSIEWARHGITATAIAPGSDTAEDDVASLVAFLLSTAGDYFSGCRLELGAVGSLLHPS